MSGGTGRIKSAQAALSLPPELEEEEEELESLDLLDSAGLLSFELDSVLLSLFLDSVPLSIFVVPNQTLGALAERLRAAVVPNS